MTYSKKVRPHGAYAHTPQPLLVSEPEPCTVSAALVRGGPELPPSDRYALAVADEATRWLVLAMRRSPALRGAAVRKAVEAVALTLRYRLHHLAVPVVLAAEERCQAALWTMSRNRVTFGVPLDLVEEPGRLVVRYDGAKVGEVPDEHEPVWRPLSRFGLMPVVLGLTGHPDEGHRLRLTVLMTNAGTATEALFHALGEGDGAETADLPELAEAARMRDADGDHAL